MAEYPVQSPQQTADDTDMGWALNALVKQPGIIHALLLTHDGLVLAHDEGMHRDIADPLAAALGSKRSLGQDLAAFCDVPERLPWRYEIVDLKDFTVLLFAGGRHTCVAVSVAGGHGSRELAVALTETFDMVKELRPQLAARDRQVEAQAQRGDVESRARTS